MRSSVKKSQLSTLRKLVNNLSDRDVKIKRDMRLFEEFFANFPITVSIWSLTTEGTVISQRGNGLICPDASCVNTLFESFDEKDKYIKVHRDALKGKSFQGTAFHNDKTFYIAVAPRRDEDENVSGARSNELENQCSEEVKEERWNRLMETAQKISIKKLEKKVGSLTQVIVEEVDKDDQLRINDKQGLQSEEEA